MKKRFRLLTLVLAFMLLFGSSITVFATGVGAQGGVSADTSYRELVKACGEGHYDGQTTGILDYKATQYKLQGGGFAMYTEVSGYPEFEFVNPTILNSLTQSAKQQFLKDQLTIANSMVADTNNPSLNTIHGVTDDTLDSMMRILQNNAGMGSQLLATLLSETKPDYASANRIYAPFAGPIGTGIALLAIVTMALLGLTMAMDIAYITIPAFQMACGGAEGGQGGGHPGQGGQKGGGVGALISKEAKKAVQAADGGSGGQAGSGEYKAAVGIYLKYRWKGLVMLGLCLLYLVQGQIYNFVAWFIDLFSGFLGF